MSEEGASARLQVKKAGFQWIVGKNTFTKESRVVHASSDFKFGLEEEETWVLELVSDDEKAWVSLNLFLLTNPRGSTRTRIRLGLIAKDGKEKNVKYERKIFTYTGFYCHCAEFITRESLFDEENGYFKDNRLTIFCILEVYRGLEVPESTMDNDLSRMLESGDFSDFTLVVSGEETKVHKCVLAPKSPFFHAMFHNDTEESRSGRWEVEDLDITVVGVKGLMKLTYTGEVDGFESGEFSDITVAVGGEELKLHKCVLSSRSSVFKAMLQHDMKESQDGRLEIKDLDVVGVKGLMSFLYTGEVEDLSEIADKVLPAANKYGVERLKAMCEQELCDKLDAENVTDILAIAEFYSAKQLKDQALSYVRVNSSEVVKQVGFWECADANRALFREIVSALADKELSMESI